MHSTTKLLYTLDFQEIEELQEELLEAMCVGDSPVSTSDEASDVVKQMSLAQMPQLASYVPGCLGIPFHTQLCMVQLLF